MHPTPAAHRRTYAALAAALVASTLAWPQLAAARSFDPGSIIIPAQIEYQNGDTTSDGTIAAYGLVYSILERNAERVKNGLRPITIYWAVEPKKLSHHRCATHTNDPPNYEGFNDNDGCDFAIQWSKGQPVVEIDESFQPAANFEVRKLKEPDGQPLTTQGTFHINSSKTYVKYSGGAWIVDATDRQAFLNLLQTDENLAHFHKDGPGRHYVRLHSARATFEAYIQRAINQKPPLVAIVGKGTASILDEYLDQAGLTTVFGAETGGTAAAHGKVYDVLDPLTDFVRSSLFPCGVLNQPADAEKIDGTRCADLTYEDYETYYRVLWAADWKIDAGSTYPLEWKNNEESAKANALENIGLFVDHGNGLFAEDSAIVTFEGVATGSEIQCQTQKVCTDPGTLVSNPFICPADYERSQCDGGATCYKCPAGTTLDTSTCPGQCVPENACPSGYEAVSGTCYSCPSGYRLNKNSPNAVSCVPEDGTCPAGFESRAGGCYDCPAGAALDWEVGPVVCYACGNNETYDKARNTCVKSNGNLPNDPGTVSPIVPNASTYPAPQTASITGPVTPLRQDATCPDDDELTCGGSFGTVDGGSTATRFHSLAGVKANSIAGNFSGADCTDYGLPASAFFHAPPGSSGHDCVDYHPGDRVPAMLFSQKGNFNFTAQTGGNVQDYTGDYKRSTWKIVSSGRVDGSGEMTTGGNAGFEFASMRHKDGDPAKGLVVYLSGHQYKFDFWGLRIILNTLLNLGLGDGETELARSEPVGYRDMSQPATGNRDLVFQGTYLELAPPLFNEWRDYSPVAPEAWRFPFTKGHLRVYKSSAIADTGQVFSSNQLFDAAAVMPAPANRTIFTVLGGSAHLGWSRISFDYTQTQSGCLDVAGISGECDLVEKLAEGNTAGVTREVLQNDAVTARQRALLGMFVQQVRGHCAFDPAVVTNYTPSLASHCIDYVQQKNLAQLGGIDHSSPAVVGPSRYITDGADANRPVVAYAGGRDGMLHAFYVGGNAEYPGLPANVVRGQEIWAFVPPGQIPWLATNNAMVDAAVNVIDVFGDFPTDADGSGTIEWSDERERPNGLREWRTVLLAAAGQESKYLAQGHGGLELFAMDVTNPTHPVLLWHVTGIREKDGRWDANGNHVFDRDATTLAITETYSDDEPKSFAIRWQDWDDSDADGVTPHIPAKYEETDETKVKLYRTGRHDFSNLGFTYGTSIGKIWTGNAYQYLAYFVTTAADFTSQTPTGFAGIDVFAIDLITGQKVWQWQKRYSVQTTDGAVIAANDIPGRPALADVDSDGSVDRVYVSDLEGRMWELSAMDGRNLIYWPVKFPANTRVSLPLFGTKRMAGSGASDETKDLFRDTTGALAQQPLTSPIGLGRFTETKEELRRYLQNRLALVQGTMGVNWAMAPFEKGNVFVLPAYAEPGTRLVLPPEGLDLGALKNTARDPTRFGVLEREADGAPGAYWQIELDVGERVYGMPRIVNNDVVFDTAFGDFTGDQLSATAADRGSLIVATKEGAPTRHEIDQGKSFAGVLIFGENVIVTSASGITRFSTGTVGVSEGGFATRPFNRNTPAVMKTWELQGEVVAPDLR